MLRTMPSGENPPTILASQSDSPVQKTLCCEKRLNSRLIIHFDINKTIIMSDPGAGVDMDDMLNSMLSECIWGYYDTSKPRSERGPADWIMLSPVPSTVPPDERETSRPHTRSPYVTFGVYLESHTDLAKAERKPLKASFCREGGVASQCGQYFQRLKNSISLSPALKETAQARHIEELSSGFYHLLPAFFNLVVDLDRRGLDFRIVFRTFGQDIPRVGAEYNLFCEGKHPAFALSRVMDGSEGSIDRRLSLPRHTACLKRTEAGAAGVHLAHVSDDDSVCITTGASEVMSVLLGWLDAGAGAIAVRDDYSFWSQSSESDDSGKLLLLSPSESRRYKQSASSGGAEHDGAGGALSSACLDRGNDADDASACGVAGGDGGEKDIIQIFFDDNIERDRAHIVDVRSADHFEAVPFSVSQDRWLHRVEPFSVITDNQYYIRKVNAILQAHGFHTTPVVE